MAKVRVNVTLFSEPIEVDEGEIPGLRGQGILVGFAEAAAEDGGDDHPDFALGGTIGEPGCGDVVPARLEAGEDVVADAPAARAAGRKKTGTP